ncbi:MAG TPA: aminoglycoside phosphotransferase family protein [Segeticoccus sp.]|uniref:aminoglycoside phosphotransferase family protein n=1 Tax=Segeticoccus sp. TaxID=2706531 RepID=UPI002D7F146B|nr:aminoglycoside phosphotransferase family protein [Segeticoccus sp.]HET8598830.1 aminoglycoside phosphotransferase family protein [Segeticoccus sp.]
MPLDLTIPPAFADRVSRHLPEAGVEGADWLRRLPRLVEECVERWQLTVDGPPRHGMAALVLPVRRTDRSPAALKVTWPHPEARHEHLALRRWDGHGAVRLLAADPSRWAMLLEWLDPTRDLTGLAVDEACTILGTLLHRLDVPALPQTARLSEEARRWAELLATAATTPRVAGGAPIPRRLLERAQQLALELAEDADVDARLVHQDLHYENVLAGDVAGAARRDSGDVAGAARGTSERGRGWLAIDPKPLAGEPAFAVAPALWNRFEEAAATADLRRALRRRVRLICAAAGIDEDRARDWAVVREAVNAVWEAETAGADTPAVLTRKVATIKAMLP